jgi:hypothetical protein
MLCPGLNHDDARGFPLSTGAFPSQGLVPRPSVRRAALCRCSRGPALGGSHQVSCAPISGAWGTGHWLRPGLGVPESASSDILDGRSRTKSWPVTGVLVPPALAEGTCITPNTSAGPRYGRLRATGGAAEPCPGSRLEGDTTGARLLITRNCQAHSFGIADLGVPCVTPPAVARIPRWRGARRAPSRTP